MAAITVKASAIDALSTPVVSVTDRTPDAAKSWMEMFTVADVALFTVTEFTPIPSPKDAVVTFCAKCVFWPVTATLRL